MAERIKVLITEPDYPHAGWKESPPTRYPPATVRKPSPSAGVCIRETDGVSR